MHVIGGGSRRRRNPINQDELEDAGAAHVIATAIDPESMAHGGRIVLDGPLSEIVEAHRYLDSIDCLGKTVVLPGVLGARG